VVDIDLLRSRIFVVGRLFRGLCLCNFVEYLNLSRLSDAADEVLKTTCIELPALDVLACLFAGDDNDQLRDLAAVHPLFELRHDLFYVRLDLVVGGHCKG